MTTTLAKVTARRSRPRSATVSRSTRDSSCRRVWDRGGGQGAQAFHDCGCRGGSGYDGRRIVPHSADIMVLGGGVKGDPGPHRVYQARELCGAGRFH